MKKLPQPRTAHTNPDLPLLLLCWASFAPVMCYVVIIVSWELLFGLPVGVI